MNTQSGFAKFQNLFAALVIPIAFVIAVGVFFGVMGAPSNFQGNDPANSPCKGISWALYTKEDTLFRFL